jgi:hypothetical protein
MEGKQSAVIEQLIAIVIILPGAARAPHSIVILWGYWKML